MITVSGNAILPTPVEHTIHFTCICCEEVHHTTTETGDIIVRCAACRRAYYTSITNMNYKVTVDVPLAEAYKQYSD